MSAEAAEGGRAVDDEDHDALRRRLYRADATEEDRSRYAALSSRVAPPQVVGEVEQEDRADAEAPAAKRPRRVLVPVAAALAVAAVVALAWIGTRASAPAPHPEASIAAPGAQVLAVTRAERSVLVTGLQHGGDAGLGAYFFAHMENRPPILQTPGRAETLEYHGTGSGTVDLAPSAAALHGGRMTVVIVLANDTRVRWRADRLGDPAGRPATWQPVVARAADLRAGVPVVATIAYAAPPPTRLVMRLPEGVRWGAAVVFTD